LAASRLRVNTGRPSVLLRTLTRPDRSGHAHVAARHVHSCLLACLLLSGLAVCRRAIQRSAREYIPLSGVCVVADGPTGPAVADPVRRLMSAGSSTSSASPRPRSSRSP
jgi:hypothetical protein